MTETKTRFRERLRMDRGGSHVTWDDLIARAEESSRRLASQLLSRSGAVSRWEQTDDVLQESLLRLYQALQTTWIESPLHFYRLAALQIRRVLVDFARKYRGAHGLATHHGTGDAARRSLEHCRSGDHRGAMGPFEWSEFHRIVSELPDRHRELFDLLWYGELPTSEAAELLGVSRRTLQRRWRSARLAFCRRWDAEVGSGRWLDSFSESVE